MFNNDFDPLAMLERLSEQQREFNIQMIEVVKAVKQHREIIEQLIEANNQTVQQLKNLTIDTVDLHDRQVLLEVARQYENSKDQN